MSAAVEIALAKDGQAALERALADPALRSLTLDLRGFTAFDSLVLWLARLPWADLESLASLSGPDGGGDHAALAIGMAGLPSTLRSLAIRDSRLGAAGVTHLMPALPSPLEAISFAGNRLDAAAVTALLARAPRGLVELDLSRNPIGDAGAAVIAAHKAGAKLARLALVDAGLGDGGRAALRAAFGERVTL